MKKECGGGECSSSCGGGCGGKSCNMFTCGTGGSCGHGNMKFLLVRWILGILIILIVFSLGMRIGEFKGQIESGYSGRGGYSQGYPTMMNPNIYQ